MNINNAELAIDLAKNIGAKKRLKVTFFKPNVLTEPKDKFIPSNIPLNKTDTAPRKPEKTPD